MTVCDTSAIVVNFNSGPALGACISRLAELKAADLIRQFVVLDNASTDGSFSSVDIASLGGVPVQTGSNLGFATAVNRGLLLAGSDDVLLVNPDALVSLLGVAALQAELLTHQNVGAVSGIIRRPDGGFQPSLFPSPTLSWAVAHLLHLKRVRAFRCVVNFMRWASRTVGTYVATAAGPARDGDWLVGACLLVRAKCLANVGTFDERFFLFYEEIDWCQRARSSGWRIRFIPVEVAVHAIGGSSSAVPSLAAYARYTSMCRYFAKHHGRRAELVVRALGFMVSLARFVGMRDSRAVEGMSMRAFVGL